MKLNITIMKNLEFKANFIFILENSCFFMHKKTTDANGSVAPSSCLLLPNFLFYSNLPNT